MTGRQHLNISERLQMSEWRRCARVTGNRVMQAIGPADSSRRSPGTLWSLSQGGYNGTKSADESCVGAGLHPADAGCGSTGFHVANAKPIQSFLQSTSRSGCGRAS